LLKNSHIESKWSSLPIAIKTEKSTGGAGANNALISGHFHFCFTHK